MEGDERGPSKRALATLNQQELAELDEMARRGSMMRRTSVLARLAAAAALHHFDAGKGWRKALDKASLGVLITLTPT